MSFFWDKFYIKKNITTKPSSFAKYCKKNFIKKNKKILEIGCGNGRDSFYFFKSKLNVTAIDKSKEVIALNKARVAKKKLLNFIHMNINKKLFPKIGKFDFVFARFFLHTINKYSEKKLLKNLPKISHKNTVIMLEFRTTQDPLFKKGKKLKGKNERYTDHYRRFIDLEEFKDTLKKLKKFRIIKIVEKKGLAKYKHDNPVVCRSILKIIG